MIGGVVEPAIRRCLTIFVNGEAPRETHSRLELSSGTRSVNQNEIPCYEDGSFLPTLPYRPASTEECLFMLSESRPLHGSAAIGICRPPERILHSLKASQQVAVDGRFVVDTAKYKLGVRDLVGWLSEHHAIEDKYVVHGFSVDESAAPTLTIGKSGKRVGLHLDTWEYQTLSDRASALNRFCLNVGGQSRYLLVFNLDISRMQGLLSDRSDGFVIDVNKIGPEFMRRFPRYPVLKLRIDPGEAYIAPTDFVVHDATSIGVQAPGCSFTIRGRLLP